MTSLSPSENYAVADEIMSEVSDMLAQGARPEDIRRDIARAQVYATLSAVPVVPVTHEAVKRAVDLAVNREGVQLTPGALQAAARAVMGLL